MQWETHATTGLKNTRLYATFNPMKKYMLVLILTLLLAQASLANVVKAMLDFHASKYLFSSEITSLNRQQKTGLAFGLGYGFEINPKMMLEAHVVYSGKGAKTELEYAPGKTAPATYSNQAISFPLFFKYRLKEGATPYAAGGPEFNFILAHKLTIEHDESINIADNTNKFIVAVNVALGYELPRGQWGLFAEIRYNRWLSDLLKSPDASVKSEAVSLVLGGIYYL
jgi:opacity protein-like surface antigen